MGFCVGGDDQYDAFLSYAHADNEAHNGWVGDFERYLKNTTIAELQRAEDVNNTDAAMFRVCRDQTGFPQGGPLNEIIDEKVRQAQFLFIFLGKGYLKSEYCLAELDIFRQSVGATVEDALKRLYVIVLDREALGRLRDGQPDRLPERRKRLWDKLRDLTQRGIRKEDFLRENGTLLPVFQRDNRADPDFHERCTPLVEEFARKLIGHRSNLRPQPRPLPVERSGAAIAIGAVPERLKRARAELIDALDGTQVSVIEEHELWHPTDEVRARLKSAKVLVQPFDDLEVLCRRGDPSGGHLAVQKALFEDCHADGVRASDASIIWWEPLSPGLAEAPQGSLIDEFDKKFLEALPAEQKRRGNPQALAVELLQSGSRPSVTASVWVEWSEADKDQIKNAKDIVRKSFDEVCEQKKREYGIDCSAELHFGDADWSNLSKALVDKPDGVVIVYNERKDFLAIHQQAETILNLPEVVMKTMFPGIFYMRSEGMYRPSDYWSVVRFRVKDHELDYDTSEVKEFVSNLFDVLYRKYLEIHAKGSSRSAKASP
jgi:hypothetical protein